MRRSSWYTCGVCCHPNLSMLEKQADRNLMKVTMEKCRFLHWGRDNSAHQYILGATQLKNSSVEMNLGMSSWTWAKSVSLPLSLPQGHTNDILGCIRQGIVSSLKEVSFLSPQVTLGLLVSALGSPTSNVGPLRWWSSWNTSIMRKGCRSWRAAAQRRGGSGNS